MLDFIAEQRIAEAIANGDFDDLPGSGKPLELDDDSLLPEELRLAYRILKNAGFVPPEIESLKGSKAERKLVLLRARIEARYYDKVIARMGGRGPRARR
ncbi:MAG TPA: DnaJ family domain-containing protein [Burkholderiales bacterium]|jgi:DnaJ-like protein